MAYLTDNAGAENVFTVGEVDIELTEPSWPGSNEDGHPDPDKPVEDLVPNEEVPKDPQIENTGTNDAIVFMTVDVPVHNVTVVKDDGSKGEKKDTEIFWFKRANDEQGGTTENNFNTDDWTELTDRNTTGTVGTPTRYVFAYNSALAKGAKALEPLFDKIQLKNIIEGEVTAGEAVKVNVKAYAIQAAEIMEADADLTDTLDEANLTKIYDIYINQNSSETEPQP